MNSIRGLTKKKEAGRTLTNNREFFIVITPTSGQEPGCRGRVDTNTEII